MTDPLSIAASVTGLLTLAGQIYTIVSDFVSNVADAPESAQAAMLAVDDMAGVLRSVKHIMDTLPKRPKHRKEMIHLVPLVGTFRRAVLHFSELEAIVKSVLGDDGTCSGIDRLKWALEEDKISQALKGLTDQKISMSLMLNVLQCDSDIEARENVKALEERVQKMDERLEQNNALILRLNQLLSMHATENASARFFDDDGDDDDRSTIRPRQGALGDVPDINNADLNWPLPAANPRDIFRRSFEITLEQTRVYRRVDANEEDASFRSDDRGSNAWSMLSGLSLNDISIISVIGLPITIEEINEIGPDLTFATIISNGYINFESDPPNDPEQQLNAERLDKQNLVTGEPPSPSLDPLYYYPGKRSPTPPLETSKEEKTSNSEAQDEKVALRTRAEAVISRLNALDKDLAQEAIRDLAPIFVLPKITHEYKREYLRHYKIVVMGGGDSGKSSFVVRFTQSHWVDVDEYDPTFEDSYRKHCVIDEEVCLLDILDTAGQEEYSAMREQYMRAGEAFILIYSITNRQSFEEIAQFHQQILRVKDKYYFPMVIVGNHRNESAESHRQVSRDEGLSLARSMSCPFHECSVEDSTNIDAPFYDAVREILKNKREERAAAERAEEKRIANLTFYGSRKNQIKNLIKRLGDQ